jgi:hypothetical protein
MMGLSKMMESVKSWFGIGGGSTDNQEHDDFIRRIDDEHELQAARVRRLQARNRRFEIIADARESGEGGPS